MLAKEQLAIRSICHRGVLCLFDCWLNKVTTLSEIEGKRLKFMHYLRPILAVILLFGSVGAVQFVPATQAQAASCIEDCRARYSQCLIQTRDRAGCTAALQRCGDGCINGRRRLGGPASWQFMPQLDKDLPQYDALPTERRGRDLNN